MCRDFEEARRPEVGHFQLPRAGDEHVARAQVAVQHPLAVCVIDGIADLAGVIERSGEIQGAVAKNHLLQRLASDVLHDDEEDTFLLLRGEYRHDVRVIQGREQARLLEHVSEIEVLFVGNLERDFLVDPGVFREEDAAEPAGAERREDPVLADRLTLQKHVAVRGV
jgi:hypothetical protein